MNRVFGALGSSHAAAAARRLARDASESSLGSVTSLLDVEEAFVGVQSDGGAVLRVARDERYALACFGVFEKTSEAQPAFGSPETPAWLLERFRTLGPAFLDGLHGAYAVLVADASSGQVWLASDPKRQRRLFLMDGGSDVFFSTQLVDLAVLLGRSLKLDRSYEEFLLAHEFLPDGRTVYQGVQLLPAGTIARVGEGPIESRAIESQPIWDDWLAGVSLESSDAPEVVASVGRAFRRALTEQLPDDERCAVMLGGFDSALVAAELVGLGKQVETFSFRYEDSSYNQPLTEELAAMLGIKHHWVPITSSVVGDGLEHYADVFNQPVCQPHYVIATAAVCRAIRARGIDHAFTGDGCDGLFLGYPTVHLRAVFVQSLSRWAPLVRGLLGPLTHSAMLERRLGHPYRVVRNVVRLLGYPMPMRGHIGSCILDAESLRQIADEPLPEPAQPREAMLSELAAGLGDLTPVRLAYRGKGAVGLNKTKLEGSTAATGITVASPFLHPGMRRLADLLPEQMLRPKEHTKSAATGKYALMRWATESGALPEKMIYQQKRSPVTAPVDQWYMGPLHDDLLRILENDLPFRVDARAARALVAPKLAEDWFRRYVGISRYAMHAPALLASYATFARAVQS